MADWFIVRTQSRAEERAAWHLNNQGFNAYLPRYSKQIRHARKSKTVLRPLFPSYVFVYIDTENQRWRAINGTVGVIELVQFGDGPKPIRAEIVEAIRARENSDGVVSLAPPSLKKGDSVRVREGAFADCVALLEEVSDQKRVFLLLDLMGREVRVSMPTENLTKVS